MSDPTADLIHLIDQRIAQHVAEPPLFVSRGTVFSVNTDARTCSARLDGGATPAEGIRMPPGVVLTAGDEVLVGRRRDGLRYMLGSMEDTLSGLEIDGFSFEGEHVYRTSVDTNTHRLNTVFDTGSPVPPAVGPQFYGDNASIGVHGGTDGSAGILFYPDDAASSTAALRVPSTADYLDLDGEGLRIAEGPSTDANTLDDYEGVGLWTPAVTFATPGNLSVTYSTQTGSYVKVGSMVTVTCRLVLSSFTHTTASGLLKITGLPFAVGAGAGVGAVMKNVFTSFDDQMVSLSVSNYLNVFRNTTSGWDGMQASDLPTATTWSLRTTVTFMT